MIIKILSGVLEGDIAKIECSVNNSFVDKITIQNLIERVERLEKFIEEIMPVLPDEIKLYLEVKE